MGYSILKARWVVSGIAISLLGVLSSTPVAKIQDEFSGPFLTYFNLTFVKKPFKIDRSRRQGSQNIPDTGARRILGPDVQCSTSGYPFPTSASAIPHHP